MYWKRIDKEEEYYIFCANDWFIIFFSFILLEMGDEHERYPLLKASIDVGHRGRKLEERLQVSIVVKGNCETYKFVYVG